MSKKNWKCTCKPTNPNIEIRDIHFELYLNPYIQKTYSRVYDVLINNHKRTYEAIYKEIREDTKEVAKNLNKKHMKLFLLVTLMNMMMVVIIIKRLKNILLVAYKKNF
ncbi:hypothetical protein [Lysinibacillus fusiformis]|uniref:Uncharacterized protein n=1 Tax=Lysinibacillus fusiformis TaxID=28031 RepID=A0A1E4R8D1_9BACI|nr:hypothetical protein [Lysinibacillus fusiformis]ODV56725.1 hypothetical protein BG258_12900 [Lysinibacillus fusiformis]